MTVVIESPQKQIDWLSWIMASSPVFNATPKSVVPERMVRRKAINSPHKGYGKVVVLMGGTSAEREISLKSGQAVLDSLSALGIDAEGLDVQGDWFSKLSERRYDVAFIALHGGGGEDGSVQGMLESIGLPYTGSGVLACALAMDKARTKQFWYGLGFPTPAFLSIKSESDLQLVAEKIGFPCAIKPSKEGSSLGITKVTKPEELITAYQKAKQFDSQVLAESWVEGEEYTVGIINGKPLPVIRIEAEQAFYDYSAKYEDSETRFYCPSGLSHEQVQSMQSMALNAFNSLSCRSWGRVDLIRDQLGVCWLLEVNTVPGLTEHSLVPMAAEHAKLGFNDMVLKILQDATCLKEASNRAFSL